MKIGILTFQRAYSYGAKLQAYALSTYLCQLGHQAEIIDYSNIGEGKAPGINFYSIGCFIKSCVSYVNSLNKEKKRRDKLQAFFLQKTPHSKRYIDSSSLNGIENRYDIFIAGSDQVWCPRYNLGDLNFLLSFVKDNKKKFSYAASFGTTLISSEYEESYRRCLSSFNKILVRETEGAKIVKSLINRDVEVVLDPTFLLSKSHWEAIARYPFKQKFNYILCFKILSVTPAYKNLIDYLQTITGYKIVVLDTSYRYKPVKGILYSTAGPEDFLGLIMNAQIIVTNSFHATVFSILFNKNFYTVLNDNGLNSRMVDLANKLGLRQRMFNCNSTFPVLEDIDIDYQAINPVLCSEIQESKRLLLSLLN